MLFQTDPNSPDVVASVRDGYTYHCPDTTSVDHHIRKLRVDYLGPNSNVSDQIKDFARQDIDHLLEHRHYLTVIEGHHAPATHQ